MVRGESYGGDGLPLLPGANTAWLLSLTCKPDNRDNFEGLLSGKTVKFYFWNRPGTLWLEPSNDTLQIRVKNYFRLPEGKPEGIQTEITVSIEKFLDECFALSPSLIQLYQGLGLESHHLVNGYPLCYQLWQKLSRSRPSAHSSPTTN